MKKRIVFLMIMLSFLVCIGISASAATSADDTATDIVRLERKHYTSGTDKMIDITVNTSFICGGFEGIFRYDEKSLEYVKSTFTNDLAANSRNTENLSIRNTENGIMAVVLGAPKTGTKGDFVTLTFKGTSTEKFQMKNAIFANSTGSQISAKVYDVMLGDATGDFEIDIFDLARLKKHEAGIECNANVQNGDCNRSGAIDADDLKQLRRYLCSDISGF